MGLFYCKWESECFYHAEIQILTGICVTAKEKLGDCYLSLFCFLHEKFFKNSESLIYVICNLNFPLIYTVLVRLIKFSPLQVFSMLSFMLYTSKLGKNVGQILAFVSSLCTACEAKAHGDLARSLRSLFKLLWSGDDEYSPFGPTEERERRVFTPGPASSVHTDNHRGSDYHF